MSLSLQITEDLKNAMKAKNESVLSTIRLLKSALKNKQIDLYGAQAKELTDEEVLAVIKTQIKQLKDAADTFAQGGRDDMAAASLAEIKTLEKYLPAQMDDATLATTVKGALSAAGITSKADAGKAMGIAMKAIAGKADAGRVKSVVDSVLVALVVGLVFHAALPTTAQAAVDTATALPAIVYVLRVSRVFMLLAGLIAVNTLLAGSFSYMLTDGNEDQMHHAHTQMYAGLIGTIVVAGLFFGFSAALRNLGV